MQEWLNNPEWVERLSNSFLVIVTGLGVMVGWRTARPKAEKPERLEVAGALIDGQTDAKWAKRQRAIDAVFWFMQDHCEGAWAAEVDAARKTLDRAGM